MYEESYREKNGLSESQLNEAQRTLHFIAENMKMQRKISEEGYTHFQQAIKALEQEPKTLDKISAEIEQAVIDDNNRLMSAEIVFDVIDKYKAESEAKE